jgi:hypothetical protein
MGASAPIFKGHIMPNTKPIGVAYEDQQLDGAVMGKAGGTAGFFGVTPTTQPPSLSTNALPTLTTANISALTTAQISALNSTLSNVNSVITDLKILGLIA